jgi:hypothetical protein
MASAARQDLTQALGNEMPDLDLGDLNPTTFLKGNVLDLLDDATSPANGNGSSNQGAVPRRPRGASGGPPEGVGSGAAAPSDVDGGDVAADSVDGEETNGPGDAGSGRSRRRGGFDADTT